MKDERHWEWEKRDYANDGDKRESKSGGNNDENSEVRINDTDYRNRLIYDVTGKRVWL